MKIHGKITMCEVREGVSERTGNEWKLANYVIVYDGKYSNGTPCQRSFKFNVMGRDKLNRLRILKDTVGTLDFETVTRTATSNSGKQYIENVVDILGWTPDANATGTGAQATSANAGMVAQPTSAAVAQAPSAPVTQAPSAAVVTPSAQSGVCIPTTATPVNATPDTDDLPF